MKPEDRFNPEFQRQISRLTVIKVAAHQMYDLAFSVFTEKWIEDGVYRTRLVARGKAWIVVNETSDRDEAMQVHNEILAKHVGDPGLLASATDVDGDVHDMTPVGKFDGVAYA